MESVTTLRNPNFNSFHVKSSKQKTKLSTVYRENHKNMKKSKKSKITASAKYCNKKDELLDLLSRSFTKRSCMSSRKSKRRRRRATRNGVRWIDEELGGEIAFNPYEKPKKKNYGCKVINKCSSEDIKNTEKKRCSGKKKALCNCRNRSKCPLQGKCLVKGIRYKIRVCGKNTTRVFYGSCTTTFKERYYQIKHMLKTPRLWRQSPLGRYVEKLRKSSSVVTKYCIINRIK